VPAIVPESRRSIDLTFGYYDKVPISYVPGNYLARYYEMVARYYQNMGDIYNNMYISRNIWRQAFDAAVYRTASLQEIKRSGYAVPDKILDKEVAKQFMENGRFSTALYNKYDKNSLESLRKQIQEDLALQRYNSEVNQLPVSSQAARFIGNMAAVRRSFDMVSFSIDSYPESEIIAYAEENVDLFKQVHLSQISVTSSEREAKQILSSIKNGSTLFEDAAKAHSQDYNAERGGDMGIMSVHELYQDIPGIADREQLIGLAQDELSGVIKLNSGWGIFKANEAVQPVDIADGATLDRVRSYISTFERGRMEDWAFAEAERFISNVKESGIDAALVKNYLYKQSFGPIAINYGDVDLFDTLSSSISELSGAASSMNFWKTAFSTPVKTPSEPFVQGNYILVLIPTREEHSDAEKIAAIRDNFSNNWLASNTEQSTRSFFLNSDKLDDRFHDTFVRYLMPKEQ